MKKDNNYANVHMWLKYHYGKADKCESKECSGKSTYYTWAKLKEKEYEKNRDNFIMLCRSCHAKYDQTKEGIEKIKQANLGKEVSKETKYKMSKAKSGEKHSMAKLDWNKVNNIRLRYSLGEKQRDIAKIYNLPYTYVWSILHNKVWVDVNYKFKKHYKK